MTAATKETVHIDVGGARTLISRSSAVQHIWQLIQRAAPTDASVLITGETGTGKELVARLIHKLSPRAGNDIVALDCSAVAPSLFESELFGHERGAFTGADRQRVGVFELADRSTLFLDEIGNTPLDAQGKLLRVLQEREFRRLGGRHLIRSDFRLITATNSDLAASVSAGSFRADLIHRLNTVHLQLPPLRERREDIPLLVSYFIREKRLRLNRPGIQRVTHDAIDFLVSYDWPGNVRELENAVEAAMIECSGDTLEQDHFRIGNGTVTRVPSAVDVDLPFRVARQRALAMFERLYLLAQLRRFDGSVKQTAQHGGITGKHVRALMKRHAIYRRDFRPPLRARNVPSSRAVGDRRPA